MSKELIAKLRKAREFEVVVGRVTFTCRRPTDVEAVEWHSKGAKFADLVKGCVVGWSGVTEDDVAGNGNADPVPFNADLWQEWIADRADYWEPIATPILNAYQAHAEKTEERQKN